MLCPNCKSKIPDNSTFCENCGVGFNPSAGSTPNDLETVKTGVSFGCVILAFIFPIFGLIFYFMFKDKKFDISKKILKASIAGLAVIIVMSALLIFVGKSIGSSKDNKDTQQITLTEPCVTVMPVSGMGKDMVKMTLSKYGAVDSSASDIGIYRIYVGSNMEKEDLEKIARELMQNKIVQSAYVEYPEETTNN